MNVLRLAVLLAAAALAGCAGSSAQSPDSHTPSLASAPERDSMLNPGDPAPDFDVLDHEGNRVRLADLRGKGPIVLIFYPMNETPGCTKQLCAARDDWQKYLDRGALLFGVNPASAESHRRFVERHRYPFPLLVDEDSRIAKAYGARGLLMIQRTVYVIDRNGKVAWAKRGLPPTRDILAAIDAAEKVVATP